MTRALIYHPGDKLSIAELTAARLDGHLVEVGPAYMPFDTLETASARAQSLARELGAHLQHVALIGSTAAWVHGAAAPPPSALQFQRIGASFARPKTSVKHLWSQAILVAADRELLGDVWVSTPMRTLADLCRRPELGSTGCAARLLIAHPELSRTVAEQLGETGTARLSEAKRIATTWREQQSSYEAVTRYTS